MKASRKWIWSNKVRLDKTTLSRALKKLENNGFIIKATNPANKKFNQLDPTHQAKDIYTRQLETRLHCQSLGKTEFCRKNHTGKTADKNRLSFVELSLFYHIQLQIQLSGK